MQPPSLTSVITVVIVIAAIGVALDKLVLSSRLDAWRRKVGQLWIKFNTPRAQGLTQDANQLFCDLFDYIYGSRAFAVRRVKASILSSMIGLVVITVILGYESTAWSGIFEEMFQDGFDFGMLIAFLVFPTLLNLIPDFFSLMETRLVLKWSKSRGLPGIFLLIIFDLILTSAIFVIALLLFAAAISLSINEPGLFLEALKQLVAMIFGKYRFLVFYLTTFVTSFFWFLFVLTFCLIWLFHRLSPLANAVYYQIGQSNRPAAALSSFLNAVIIIVYTLWKLLDWAII